MSWLAVLLIGFSVADLAHSVKPIRFFPECLGALVALLVALLAGLTSGRDVIGLLAIAALVLLWGLTVTRGFGRPGPAWLPLTVFAVSIALAIGCSGLAPEAAGPLGRWLDSVTLPVLSDLSEDRFLLLVGAFGLQLSTGNVIVRLVLKTTGTIDPPADGRMPRTPLKGGRLLGPLERVFILALALGGEFTAAGVVIAAKGLLRFPELSSRRDQERIHQLTEYFLLGSFVSWTVALASYVLLA